jgi:hypothetical protein
MRLFVLPSRGGDEHSMELAQLLGDMDDLRAIRLPCHHACLPVQ